MKYSLIVGLIIASPTCVSAQTTLSAPIRYADLNILNRSNDDGMGSPSYRPYSPTDRESCLRRKITRRVECHTFAEWRTIAQALDNTQGKPRN